MKRILIVEDEFPIALDLESRVKKMGYQVVGIANTYESCLMEVEQHQPNLIFLDINLSDKKSGLDIARWLNENYKHPFIFITAYSDTFTFQQALELNPAGFLNKPVNDPDLYHQVELAMKNYEVVQSERKQFLADLDAKLKRSEQIEQSNSIPAGWEDLSKREKEVLMLLGDGLSDKDLAEQLFVSVTTVRTHLRRAYDKLLINSRLEAVSLLTKHGLM